MFGRFFQNCSNNPFILRLSSYGYLLIIPVTIFGHQNLKSLCDSLNILEKVKTSTKKNAKDLIMENYEHKVKQFSSEDKIFRFYASVQDEETKEIYMTIDDFLHSLLVNVLPRKINGFHYIKMNVKSFPTMENNTNGLFKLFPNGLISYPDYLFLLTILGVSEKQMSIAFTMCDLNNDGFMSKNEFCKTFDIFYSSNNFGLKSNHNKTISHFTEKMTFIDPFFKNFNREKINLKEFLELYHHIQNAILHLEFDFFKSSNRGHLTCEEFSFLLRSYSSVNRSLPKLQTKIQRMLSSTTHNCQMGISFEEYSNFHKFLLNLKDIDTALSFTSNLGKPIDKATFTHVARAVSGMELSPCMVDVIFAVFDENDDNNLSNEEFLDDMKSWMNRGLKNKKSTDLYGLFSLLKKCASNSVSLPTAIRIALDGSDNS